MTECHRNVLRKVRVYMLENLEVDLIITHLVSELILTALDEDELSAAGTKRKRITHLLEILPRKGDLGYTKFMKVLQEHQNFIYVHMREMEKQCASSLPLGKFTGNLWEQGTLEGMK